MRTSLLIAAGAAIALGGCAANNDRINHVQLQNYYGSYAADASTQGPVPVRVYGRPAAGANEIATATAIAGAMEGANFGPRIAYEPATELPADGYVMVVRFGEGTPANSLCSGDSGDGVGTAYAAAFCLGEYPLSYLAGDAGTSNIDSPGFRQAMATAANELLPLENPEYNDCGKQNCL